MIALEESTEREDLLTICQLVSQMKSVDDEELLTREGKSLQIRGHNSELKKRQAP